MKRKRFPELCSKLLSNTLKIEINNLKSANVELNSSSDNNATWCISDKLKNEIRQSVHDIKSLDTLNKAEDVLQNTRSTKCVMDQIQREKTCEMDIYLRRYSKDYKNTWHQNSN
ncbi:uncharacterized protein LOC110830082 isoform X2 [Zootermopsis nevadensis]|nr:uncharacterized protein LOC110830082 isoform X2 [Zootermopsis nevadensis]